MFHVAITQVLSFQCFDMFVRRPKAENSLKALDFGTDSLRSIELLGSCWKANLLTRVMKAECEWLYTWLLFQLKSSCMHFVRACIICVHVLVRYLLCSENVLDHCILISMCNLITVWLIQISFIGRIPEQ